MPYIYAFDHKHRKPPMDMKDLLGGKGANLAEMTSVLGLPVPGGFTITTSIDPKLQAAARAACASAQPSTSYKLKPEWVATMSARALSRESASAGASNGLRNRLA